jgi:predicted transcriptional regulator
VASEFGLRGLSAAGAVAQMRPGKKGKEMKRMQMETRNVRFERGTLKQVRRLAEERGVSESEIIRDAVEEFVKEREGMETELEATLTELYVIKAYATQLMRQAVGDAKVEELKEAAIRAAKKRRRRKRGDCGKAKKIWGTY